MEALYPRYVKALKKELVEHFFAGRSRHLDTVFLGGGTPSVLSADHIEEILSCCREYLGVSEKAEISLEVNPKTVDFMKLLQLRQAGVNRLSIGIQSFLDTELMALGRLHNAQDGWNCVRDAIGAGFENISLDLMYGVSGQSAEMWRWNLETAISLGLPHLSLYQLTIEEGTPFQSQFEAGKMELPDEEEIYKMDLISAQLTEEAGYEQYEISNFAKDGFQCRHNVNYWHNLEYIAAGAGGVGFLNGERAKNIQHPLKYCEAVEAGETLIEESEKLALEESFRESVVMGLRMVEGVSYSTLYERYGINLSDHYGDILDPLLENGFVEFTDSHFRLTHRGMQIANQILAKLV